MKSELPWSKTRTRWQNYIILVFFHSKIVYKTLIQYNIIGETFFNFGVNVVNFWWSTLNYKIVINQSQIEEKLHKEKQMLRESLNTESLEVNKRVDKVNIDRMNDVSDIQSKVNVVSGLTSRLIVGLIVIDFEPLKKNFGISLFSYFF